MDRKECMIVDLDKRGSKDMFVTERIAAIKENSKGLWSVLFFLSHRRLFPLFSYRFFLVLLLFFSCSAAYKS